MGRSGGETVVPGLKGYSGLALAGALAAALAGGGGGTLQAKPAGGAGLEKCPSQSLPVFLRRFSESVVVQRAFSYFPLKLLHVVDGPNEPETLTTMTGRGSVSYPIYPSRRAAAAERLETTIEERGRSAIVTLNQPDTDYQIRFRFVRTDCWYLTERHDMSL
jgi:hypothetical protein